MASNINLSKIDRNALAPVFFSIDFLISVSASFVNSNCASSILKNFDIA